MKQRRVSLFAILLLFCLPVKAQDPITPIPIVQEMVALVSIDSLVKHLRILTGADSVLYGDRMVLIDTREMHTFGNAMAALYLKESMYSLGGRMESQPFGGWCFMDRPCGTNENVFSYLRARDAGFWDPIEPYYMISAHFDSYSRDIYPAPGADDNATGTAAVLEAARVISELTRDGDGGTVLEHPIVFAFWDAEEIGLNGSNHYAGRASDREEGILGVVNLDMLGYDGDNDRDFWIMGNSRYHSGLAEFLLALNDIYSIDLGMGHIDWDRSGSDHYPFWRFGYPAATITESWWTGDVNPHYHAASDTVGHLNLETYHRMVKLAVAAIGHLAMSPEALGTPIEASDELPGAVALAQAYPNPFRHFTTIRIDLPEPSRVRLIVFDMTGRQIETLIDAHLPTGRNSARFDRASLAAGTYMYRLEVNGAVEARLMTVLR